MKKNFIKSGFTLVELLIVITVLGVLAGLVFVALNPLERFQDSRNAKRWADVNLILSAIKLDQIDNGGSYMGDINDLSSDLYYQVGNGSSCNDTCANPTVILQTDCIDIEELVDDGYLPSVPIDPNDSNAGEDETRYYLVKGSNGTITVGSCSEEKGSNSVIPSIVVSR
jgi:prepilin-type N-terminal cleavage/methylation domain-containing protein